jgi:DHA1 family multidrug resistance protein-like MFS transporter
MGGFPVRFPWDKTVEESELGAHWFGRMLTALYFSTFMIRASFAIMLIAFPIYILGLKSYFLFGVVLASSPLFELITVIGLGAYIDKHGRKNVLLLGLLTGSLALFGLLLTKDPVLLFVINAFHGVSAAAILVSSLALIADYAPKKNRGKIMGAFDFVNLFGWIVGFGIGGLLIDTFKSDIGMIFVVAGLMGVVAWVWATLNVQEPRKEGRLTSEISFKMIASVIKQRNIVLLIAPWFIIYLLVSTLLTFTSKAGTQELGLTGKDLAVLLGGGGTLFLVTQVAYGWASDKYGRTKIMIVGTVGIVGIMLTVGSVFLTAPALIAPAGHTVYSAQLDGDASPEYLLQSSYGLYLVNDDGTVLRELGPPEGGFGHLIALDAAASGSQLVSFTHDAVQVISTVTGAVTWVDPAREPSVVRPTDLNGDGAPEIFFVDEHGLHIQGPSLPSSLPTLPPGVGPGQVKDAQWDGTTLYLLASNGSQVVLFRLTAGAPHSAQVDAGSTGILLGDPSRPGSVLLRDASGATLVDAENGTAIDWFPFPAGLTAASMRFSGAPAFVVVAYPPSGGGAMVFERPAGPSTFALIDLPGNLAASRWQAWGGTPLFLGYAANGTLSTTALARTGVSWSETAQSHQVLVKRETAQSTFGKLTSPALLVPLGVFALMAGAFGPAALAGLTDVSQSDKRGTTMGLYSVVISSSMIVGPITTGFLVDNYGGFGVMIFLASSAAAMAILMAVRALDVRRQGGEEQMMARAAEKDLKDRQAGAHPEEE